MDIEKRLMEYYKRWNIEFSSEEQFRKFKYQIISTINESLGNLLVSNNEIDKSFSKIIELHQVNEPKVKTSSILVGETSLSKMASAITGINNFSVSEKGFGDTHVYKEIKSAETPQELAIVLQALFWALEEDKQWKDISPHLLNQIRRLSKMTPSVSFNIVERGGEVIIYPYGDEFLDKGIVDYVISGLENYPNAAKQFDRALKIYQGGDTSQFRNLLDDLRLALEELVNEVLGTNKSLENVLKKELKNWLTEKKKLHANINTLYSTLLGDYTHYQNDAVKHGEKYSLDEVEFMLYLTASFMRLIIQLANN